MGDFPPQSPPPPPPPPGYGQQGYQPYQPYQPYSPGVVGPPPNNNLVWAILTTIFCCQIPGIVSIVYAAQVNGKWYQGDHAGAQQAARNARTWAIVAVGVWFALAAVYVLFFIAVGFGSSTTSDF